MASAALRLVAPAAENGTVKEGLALVSTGHRLEPVEQLSCAYVGSEGMARVRMCTRINPLLRLGLGDEPS